jgi:hypothetical protein
MLQSEALDILKMGHNVFLTGAAGSGKTHTLRAYISYLHEHHIPVAITASTGIAATHIGGMTIHSWSGLGIKDRLTPYDLELLKEKRQLWKRYQETEVLIIDEISMLHHFRFDLLNTLAQTFRGNTLPFGGMQIVMCGDFFQLPPVSRIGEPPAYFAYRSNIWHQMQLKICYLSEQHRQHDDRYVSLLNDIRRNDITEETLECLRERYKKSIDLDIEPTRLSTHNENVDSINHVELSKIKGTEKRFTMLTKGKAQLVETLKKSCLAPEELVVKESARVMFVKNNPDKGYANGTLGIIESFTDEGDPVVRTAQGKRIEAIRESWMVEEDGKMKAELSQYPLRLAWAITIHKSQGMSLDAAEIDLSRSFAPGMGYVALSRVRSLAGLSLTGFSHQALQIHPEVLDIDKELQRKSDEAVTDLISLGEGFGTQSSVAELQEAWRTAHASKKPQKHTYVTEESDDWVGLVSESGTISEEQLTEHRERMRRHIKQTTQQETKSYLIQKASIEDIASARGLTVDTIVDHIELLVQEGVLDREGIDISYLRPLYFKGVKGQAKFNVIQQAFQTDFDASGAQGVTSVQSLRLAPIKNKLGNSYSYLEIRIVRMFIYPDFVL